MARVVRQREDKQSHHLQSRFARHDCDVANHLRPGHAQYGQQSYAVGYALVSVVPTSELALQLTPRSYRTYVAFVMWPALTVSAMKGKEM